MAHLRGHGVGFAVIGAAAMAVHGVVRSTRDLDLFTLDRQVLNQDFWRPLARERIDAVVARGQADDPLAGVARLRRGAESPVDVIVGRHAWQGRILQRARESTIEDVAVPVAGLADLVLLKLFAGGPQDAWDIVQLLADSDLATVIADVEGSLGELPPESRALWRRIRAEG